MFLNVSEEKGHLMTRNGAAAAYRSIDLESAVASASAHELVSLLFKELNKSLLAAEYQFEQGNKQEMRNHITKASRVLAGLQGSLDFEKGGEIANNLASLYGFAIRQLFRSNASGDVENVVSVKGLIAPIAEAWDSISPHHQHAGATNPSAVGLKQAYAIA
jgi:flagellar protein FliS